VTRADTLLQIKDAESKASQIMIEADEKQKALVVAARKDAVRKIQDAEENQRAEFESAYAAEKGKVASQRDDILSKGREEASSVKGKAERNIPKAKAHLKQAFEEGI
jgi:V/A-type H+/Na+-transporting ATPase subunit G/H